MGRFVLGVAILAAGCGQLPAGLDGSPPPLNQLPKDQILEGGVQMRISPAGLSKVQDVSVSSLAAALSGVVVCVPPGSSSNGIYSLDYCDTDVGGCTPGCPITVSPNSVNIATTGAQTKRVALQMAATGPVHISTDFPVSQSCNATYATNQMLASVNLDFEIDPTTGKLTISDQSYQVTTNATLTGCAFTDVSSMVVDIDDAFISQFTSGPFRAAITDQIQTWMPSPSEILTRVNAAPFVIEEGVDLGKQLELRLGPGGYSTFASGGASFGVITGINSDEDPNTRGPQLSSEPDYCVLGMAPFDMSAVPYSLTPTTRQTFALGASGPFVGAPDNTDDVTFGISRTTLDLFGHHLVASGSLCLTLDEAWSASIRRDTLDDLVGIPLGAADAPARVVLHPSAGLTHQLDGTAGAPLMRGTLPGVTLDFDVDEGAGYETAVRVTTDVVFDMGLGLRRYQGGQVILERTVSNIDVANTTTEVVDARYQSIVAADLEAFLPSLVDLVFGTFGEGALPIFVPGIAGLDVDVIGDPRVIGTSSDDFVAFGGDLTASPFDPGPDAGAPDLSGLTVDTSTAEDVHDALRGAGGALPSVHIPLGDGPYDWHLSSGAWRPVNVTGGELVIEDEAFAWQGVHTISLRAASDAGIRSSTATADVTIDYAPPTIFTDDITVDTNEITVPARDAVTPSADLERAVGAVDDPVPTVFASGETVALGALATESSVIAYVRDDAGHIASTEVQLLGSGGAGGGSEGGSGEGGSSEGGSSDGGAASAGGASSGGSSSEGGGAASDSGDGDGGCDCRAAQPAPRNAAWVFLFAIAAVARRRLRVVFAGARGGR